LGHTVGVICALGVGGRSGRPLLDPGDGVERRHAEVDGVVLVTGGGQAGQAGGGLQGGGERAETDAAGRRRVAEVDEDGDVRAGQHALGPDQPRADLRPLRPEA